MAESLKSLKLTYFNIKARGEPIRLAMKIAGLEFEDDRISGGKRFYHIASTHVLTYIIISFNICRAIQGIKKGFAVTATSRAYHRRNQKVIAVYGNHSIYWQAW